MKKKAGFYKKLGYKHIGKLESNFIDKLKQELVFLCYQNCSTTGLTGPKGRETKFKTLK